MRRLSCATLLLALATTSCTSTDVTEGYSGGPLPRPDRVLVYDFATTPGEVRLDRGLSAKVVEAAKSEPRDEQERALGIKVADALAEHLVKAIRDQGLPAQRASGAPPTYGNSVLIEGQLVSIDQGNRTARMVIGLGAGRSDVEAHVQVYQHAEGGEQTLQKIDVSAKGGRTPGAAETMGVGAVTGHLVVSGVMTASSQTADETVGGTVTADARRAAKHIAEELKPLFERQGWLD